MSAPALGPLTDAIRASGLVGEGDAVLALCSGGADSAGLAAGLAAGCGPERVLALHVDYGLRPDSGLDAERCAQLCERLGIELVVERPRLAGKGNVQAEAREARYAAAERLRSARGLDLVATGHTRTDLAETVIYRLASSPGARPLLGMRQRRGRIVRPLLRVGRAEVRAVVAEAGLPYRDDPGNEQPLYARNRIRAEVLPVLREIAPAVEATIAETQAELAEDAVALEAVAGAALAEVGADAAGVLPTEALADLDPAVARLAMRALAERAAGRPVPLGRQRAAEIRRLAGEPEGGVVELGGGVEARIEHGYVRFIAGADSAALEGEALLPVPGNCRFGAWELRAELREGRVAARGPESAYLDPEALGDELVVRAWREGDRIRPLGLDGTKSLQDLFTDRRVPRSLRRTLPVVTTGERIVWIAGVAVSQEFAVAGGGEATVVLTAGASPGRPGPGWI